MFKIHIQQLLDAMVWLFETNMPAGSPNKRRDALSIAALCVGGMVLARTLPDSDLAEEVRIAAHGSATELFRTQSEKG